MAKSDKSFGGFWKTFFRNVSDHNLPLLSAAIAYYTTLSLSPLVLLSVVLIGTLYPSAQDRFVADVGALTGPQGAKVIRTIVDNASTHPDLGKLAGWIAVVVLLFSASAVFGQLQMALNRVWDMTTASTGGIKTFIRRRVFSAGVLLAVLFLTLVSFVAQALLNLVADSEAILLKTTWWAISVLIYAALFSTLYRWLPDGRVPWWTAFRGGLITTFLFMIGRALIGLYLAHSHTAGAYGPAGALIVLLLWLYYSTLVFLLSAELLYSIARYRDWSWAEMGHIGTDARKGKASQTRRDDRSRAAPLHHS
jgi:membrane protein